MEKSELRISAKKLRDRLSPEQRQKKSETIGRRLAELPFFRNANRILFYYGILSEVSTDAIIGQWINEKKLFLPHLIDDSFVAAPLYAIGKCTLNRYRIPEPPIQERKKGDSNELDLIIIPGLAFDRKGNRIGTGKGYYDRFLKQYPAVPRVALAFGEQILDQVPKDPYDEPIDWIITENEVIRCEVSP